MKSTKLFVKVSLSLYLIFVVTSCCSFNTEQTLTRFPAKPPYVNYTTDPVISFNKSDKTYIITSEYMENSLLDVTYIDEITKWKRENGVK